MRITLRDQRGIALVLAMLLTMAMSLAVASMLVMAQTETLSTTNYRLMSQARYGAESGVQKTVNHLLNTYTAPPGVGNADPITAYTTTVSPVTYNGQPVILSADPSVASNYPVAAVQTAFQTALAGSLPSGTTTVNFAPYARLVAMQQVRIYGGTTATLQTWEIVSTGTITQGKPATVEVSAILERQKIPAQPYAAFGTSATCGAITLSGTTVTDSYNSSAYSGSGGITSTNGGLTTSGGNVGTNGNLTASGGATVNGTLSTPRVGVGNCSNGNVTAETASGGATVTGGIVQLPQAITMPTPDAPSPMPPTTNLTINSSANCASLGLSPPATCSGSSGDLTINANGSTLLFGDITISGGANVTLVGGTPAIFNINSLTVSGTSHIGITTGAVVMNVAGKNNSGGWMSNPFDTSGTSFTNSSMDPSKLQILYAGTETIRVSGGNDQAMVVYAPNAPIQLSGNSAFYGSLIGSTIADTGGAPIHYDRNLSQIFFAAGNSMLSAFSWNKY
jgi:hypothetical protein